MAKKNRHINIGDVIVGNDLELVLIAGPCALESREHAIEMCHALVEMTSKMKIGFIYKTSFDKGNRTSISSSRGIGMDRGLPILSDLRSKFGCPVLTDVHTAEQCQPVSEVADVLQIPAFLCRQTDLLIAAAHTR